MGTEILEEVFRVIKDRKKNPIQDSYVSGLMSKGRESILDKVREESMELIKASEVEGRKELIHESADLIFHIMVLLGSEGVEFEEVLEELRRRRKPRETE